MICTLMVWNGSGKTDIVLYGRSAAMEGLGACCYFIITSASMHVAVEALDTMEIEDVYKGWIVPYPYGNTHRRGAYPLCVTGTTDPPY